MTTNATDHRSILGARLFRLAVDLSRTLTTQRDREEAIKAVPGRKRLPGGIRGAREMLDAAIADIQAARKTRQARRRGPKVGQRPWPGRGALPTGTLEERFTARTRFAVTLAARRSLDLSVSGGVTVTVDMTTDPRKVGARVVTGKDWSDQYRGAYKGWAKTSLDARFTVPRGWLRRVERRQLAYVGGLLTLDAQQLDCREPGVEVFAARWAAQSRGKSVRVEDGYIARDGVESFHGRTYASAVAGLRRKLRASTSTPAERAERADRSAQAFANRWANKDFTVSVQDARATGSCEYGIRSWCYAVGLAGAYEQGGAPVSDVVAAYRGRPLPEVRRAVLHAARHVREEVAA